MEVAGEGAAAVGRVDSFIAPGTRPVYTQESTTLKAPRHWDVNPNARARMIGSGTVFGPYRVIEKIGAGGMGEVYRALDPRLEREVALKIISDSFLVSDPTSSPSPAGTPRSRDRPLP